MKFMRSALLLLITGLTYGQAFPQSHTIEGNIDSILCPIGYASIGHPYPSFKLINDRKTVDNQSTNGKVVFINFWFEGCHPCMAEMEALNKLFVKMKDNKEFVFLTVTWDNEETVKRVKEKYSLLFDIFPANKKECQRLNFGCGYPTSIILDKKGTIKYRHSGGSIDIEKADEFVMTTLLAEIKSLL